MSENIKVHVSEDAIKGIQEELQAVKDNMNGYVDCLLGVADKLKKTPAKDCPLNNNELIAYLQIDLANERKHMMFYLQASVMVEGLHREELSEFFYEEAQDEMKHVEQFSRTIVHLGGVPWTEISPFISTYTRPEDLLGFAQIMEQEVANNYALRLRQTHEMENAAIAYIHVFYEDQLRDSQKTAWEIAKMLTKVR